MTKCSIFCPHLNSACSMFRVKSVNCHSRNDVRWIIYIYIYMKNPPFDSLVWGSLRLAPITYKAFSFYFSTCSQLSTTKQNVAACEDGSHVYNYSYILLCYRELWADQNTFLSVWCSGKLYWYWKLIHHPPSPISRASFPFLRRIWK